MGRRSTGFASRGRLPGNEQPPSTPQFFDDDADFLLGVYLRRVLCLLSLIAASTEPSFAISLLLLSLSLAMKSPLFYTLDLSREF